MLFSKIKIVNQADYDTDELRLLSPACKKVLRHSGIPANEAAENLGVLLNCLYFETRKDAEARLEVRKCMKEYKKQHPDALGKRKSTIPSSHSNPLIVVKGADSDGIEDEEPTTSGSSADKGDESAGSLELDETSPRKKKKGSAKSKKNTQSKEEDKSPKRKGSAKKDKKEKKETKKKEEQHKSAKKHEKDLKEFHEQQPKSPRNHNKGSTAREKTEKEHHHLHHSTTSKSPREKSEQSKSGHRTVADAKTDLLICENPSPYFGGKVRIGKGGFGEVMTAKDKVTGHTVAIKVLKRKFSEDSANILNEIENLQSCHHQNIVNYVRSYLYNDKVHIVMEYCDGGSLNTLINSIDLSESQICLITKGILTALAFLHEKNRIHRDIKSDNILLNMNGVIKVADLGLVAELDGEDDSRRSIAGSRFWMAPEMIQRRPYGCKVDIWSLGAVIIEMAEKNPPYSNLRSLRALFNTATKGAPPLKKPKKWSPEFKVFLQRCFEMDPDKRPSAAELLEDEWIVKKAASTSKLVQSLGMVFLGNSIRMNGF